MFYVNDFKYCQFLNAFSKKVNSLKNHYEWSTVERKEITDTLYRFDKIILIKIPGNDDNETDVNNWRKCQENSYNIQTEQSSSKLCSTRRANIASNWHQIHSNKFQSQNVRLYPNEGRRSLDWRMRENNESLNVSKDDLRG